MHHIRGHLDVRFRQKEPGPSNDWVMEDFLLWQQVYKKSPIEDTVESQLESTEDRETYSLFWSVITIVLIKLKA